MDDRNMMDLYEWLNCTDTLWVTPFIINLVHHGGYSQNLWNRTSLQLAWQRAFSGSYIPWPQYVGRSAWSFSSFCSFCNSSSRDAGTGLSTAPCSFLRRHRHRHHPTVVQTVHYHPPKPLHRSLNCSTSKAHNQVAPKEPWTALTTTW